MVGNALSLCLWQLQGEEQELLLARMTGRVLKRLMSVQPVVDEVVGNALSLCLWQLHTDHQELQGLLLARMNGRELARAAHEEQPVVD